MQSSTWKCSTVLQAIIAQLPGGAPLPLDFDVHLFHTTVAPLA
jgi:hypothetical protein